jgi:hypothetical protein
MRFPNRSGRLFWVFFWLVVGPLVLILLASVWLYWTLEPLQKIYLPTYAATSMEAGIPHSETTIRWVMKTAPRRKAVTVSAEDVVAASDPKLPVRLSSKAIAEGWRGVAYSAPQEVPAAPLARGLQEYVYDGVSVWWLFGRPMLNSLALLLLPYAIWLWMKEHSVRFRFTKKHGRLPEFIERQLPESAPRPSPPTPVARTEQPRTPAAAQATLPLFDAPADNLTDKPKEAFVWDESKGIE